RTLTGMPPRLKVPPGTCDTHIHFYGGNYATVPGTPTPPDATVADYRQVKTWLGIERCVVVQPNAYGDDNRLTMAATAELGSDTARAVVVVKPGIGDAELEQLSKAGARGLRIMALLGGTLGMDVLEEMAARVHPFGWYVLVQLDGRDLPQHEGNIRRLGGHVIIDHTGQLQARVPGEHACFDRLPPP